MRELLLSLRPNFQWFLHKCTACLATESMIKELQYIFKALLGFLPLEAVCRKHALSYILCIFYTLWVLVVQWLPSVWPSALVSRLG